MQRSFLPGTVKVGAQHLTAGIVKTITATETQRVYKKTLTIYMPTYIHLFSDLNFKIKIKLCMLSHFLLKEMMVT